MVIALYAHGDGLCLVFSAAAISPKGFMTDPARRLQTASLRPFVMAFWPYGIADSLLPFIPPRPGHPSALNALNQRSGAFFGERSSFPAFTG